MSKTKSAENKLSTALEELSPREQLAVKGLLAGKTQSQALLDAGYSESMAMKQQKKVIGRARVQNALAAALEDFGIDAHLLAQTIREGLEAVRVVSSGPGRPAMEVPDHNVRHKFLQTALELRGDYPDKTIHQVEESYEERILRLR
jgi:hypothetical protein